MRVISALISHSPMSEINIFAITRGGGRGPESYERNYHKRKCLQLMKEEGIC